MRKVKLSAAPKGEFFKRKKDAREVYTKGHFNRSSKRYSCSPHSDMNRELFLKGDTLVYIGFDY